MDYVKVIEDKLKEYLPNNEERKALIEKCLVDSMEYSLEAGGKRIRPTLVILFAKAFGADVNSALPFACGIEMIHTYSLIHDDLPCMDDDDLRRGKPSNHKAFGEDIALLAGDALLTNAFSVMLSSDTVALVGAEKAVKCTGVMADYAGYKGMIGGQVIDLLSEHKKVSLDVLKNMHQKKTGALIKSACTMGAIIGGATDEEIGFATAYGENLGLAFQIMDDILDVTSSVEELGKPIGSDKENEKSTFVTLLGLEECKKLVKEYTANAINALSNLKGDTEELKAIALKMSERKN